jgi:hypothetical protein
MEDARALAAKCRVEYVVAKPAEAEELLRIVDTALGLKATAAMPAHSFEDFDTLHVRVLTDKVSAQAEEVVAQEGALNPSIPFLQKPFTARMLALKVRDVLDAIAVAGMPEDLTNGAKRPPVNVDDPGLPYPA